MRACHQKIFAADFGCAALGAAAMNRAILADDVVVSDLHSRFPFGRERNILRRRADDCAVSNEISAPDCDLAFNYHMRLRHVFFTEHHLWPDDRERSDLHTHTDLGSLMDKSRSMNSHAAHLISDFEIRISDFPFITPLLP